MRLVIFTINILETSTKQLLSIDSQYLYYWYC